MMHNKLSEDFNRISEIVSKNLGGAKLLAVASIQSPTDERHYIVLWHKPDGRATGIDEYGTHYVQVNDTLIDTIWGHYHTSLQAMKSDFSNRAGMKECEDEKDNE